MDALGRRDLDRLLELSDPEVEWRSFFAVLGEGGVYRGREGTEHYLRDLFEAFEVSRADVDDMLVVGEVAVLVGRIRYRGRDSGVDSFADAGWMLKFRAGKLLVFQAFRDPEAVLGGVGHSS